MITLYYNCVIFDNMQNPWLNYIFHDFFSLVNFIARKKSGMYIYQEFQFSKLRAELRKNFKKHDVEHHE